MSDRERSKIKGKDIAMIFQDPMTALNPLKKVGSHIEEVIIRHKKVSREEGKETCNSEC